MLVFYFLMAALSVGKSGAGTYVGGRLRGSTARITRFDFGNHKING